MPLSPGNSGRRLGPAGLGYELDGLVDGGYGDQPGRLPWRRGFWVRQGGGQEDQRVGSVLLPEGVGLVRGFEEGGGRGGG